MIKFLIKPLFRAQDRNPWKTVLVFGWNDDTKTHVEIIRPLELAKNSKFDLKSSCD